MKIGRRHDFLRGTIAALLSVVMVVSGIPTEALAQAVEEVPTTEAAATPTEADVAKSLIAQVKLAADANATSEDLARAYASAAVDSGLTCEVVRTEEGDWWNRVSVDGTWYHVDTSTDDVVLLDDAALFAAYPNRSEWVEGDATEGSNVSEGNANDGKEGDEQRGEAQEAVSNGENPESSETKNNEGNSTNGAGDAEESTDTAGSDATNDPKLETARSAIDITIAVIADISDQTYTGSPIEPEVTVTYGSSKLTLNTDYTVSYDNNTNVGEATVKVSGMGGNPGNVEKTFNIVAASLSAAKIQLEKTSYVYTGSQIKPKVSSVMLGGTKLTTNDYTVSYENNTKVGTAAVKITGKGNYTDSASASFTISAPASISKAKVTLSATSFAYSGSAIKPAVKSVVLNGKTLTSDTDYDVSYSNNTKVGTGTVTVKGKGSYKDSAKATFKIVEPTITYRAHCQAYSWRPWSSNGATNGTIGESKRMEAVQMKLGSGFPVSGGVQYCTHVQGIGWTGWSADGATSGTTGQSKRVEAIQIQLTGSMKSQYDVYYRVHSQKVGWTAWGKNGQTVGTTGMSWRAEAMQVKLVRKNASAPSASGSNTSLTNVSNPGVTYRSYVQNSKWSAWSKNGGVSGTTGKSKRVEAIEVKLAGTAVPGSIRYSTHIQGIGWTGWSADGATSGTTGQSKRVEAMKIQLSGEASKYFDIYYRAHIQSAGWLGWAKNGEAAGSTGASKRLEAYQVKLVPKDATAPGSRADHIVDASWFKKKAELEAIRKMQSDPMYKAAQGYSSPTGWLILVDCTTCNVAIFQGSTGNWLMKDKYSVGVGAYDSPSKHGIFSIGYRGYSFGDGSYTAYYYVQYYNDYLFHSIIYWPNSFDVKDGRLGQHVSHGCVRQRLDKAKWLYDNIPYGTTVVIYDS